MTFIHKSKFLYNQQMSLSLSPLAPIAFYILAHPVAKYLFIKVCPKFAISHIGCHHVKLKKASVDGRVKDNCKKLWTHDDKQARIYKLNKYIQNQHCIIAGKYSLWINEVDATFVV